jgi:hypothetical protein
LTFTVRPAMDNVPSRFLPWFPATVIRAVPLPLPFAPSVTTSQDSFDLAVHVQPLPVDTLIVLVPPSASTSISSGEIEKVHVGGGSGGGDGGGGEGGGGGVPGAACVTVNARPAIVSVPVRAGPMFAPTLNPTEPFPLPLAPDVTVIHVALLTAVHRHPACVDTATVPASPDAAAFWAGDEIANVHDALAAACVTSAR